MEIYFIFGMIITVVLLGLGFLAGRMPIRSDKQFDPGKIPLTDHDPYQEALQAPEEIIKDRE